MVSMSQTITSCLGKLSTMERGTCKKGASTLASNSQDSVATGSICSRFAIFGSRPQND